MTQPNKVELLSVAFDAAGKPLGVTRSPIAETLAALPAGTQNGFDGTFEIAIELPAEEFKEAVANYFKHAHTPSAPEGNGPELVQPAAEAGKVGNVTVSFTTQGP